MSDFPRSARNHNNNNNNKRKNGNNNNQHQAVPLAPRPSQHQRLPSNSSSVAGGHVAGSESSSTVPHFNSPGNSSATIPHSLSSTLNGQQAHHHNNSKHHHRHNNNSNDVPSSVASVSGDSNGTGTTGTGTTGVDHQSTGGGAGGAENSLQRLHQRQKQILFGKATSSYINYISCVPMSRREANNPLHPVTPRPDLHNTKRQFDASVRSWRRALHVWDEEGTAATGGVLPTLSASTSAAAASSATGTSVLSPSKAPDSGYASSAEDNNNNMMMGKKTQQQQQQQQGDNNRRASSFTLLSTSSTRASMASMACHPFAIAQYKHAIRRAGEALQHAVRHQFPSSVAPPEPTTNTASKPAQQSGSTTPGEAPNLLLASGGGGAGSSLSNSPALAALLAIQPPQQGANDGAASDHDAAAALVALWLQQFDDLAVQAEQSLFGGSDHAPSEQRDSGIPSSAFSMCSEQSDCNAGGHISSSNSSTVTTGLRHQRVVPVVTASKAKQQQNHNYLHSNVSSNFDKFPSLVDDEQSMSPPQHQHQQQQLSHSQRSNSRNNNNCGNSNCANCNGSGRASRQQQHQQQQIDISAGGSARRRRHQMQEDEAEAEAGGEEAALALLMGEPRALRLSSLASSDTPSHLVLKMYEKHLPQLQFTGAGLADRGPSPLSMQQMAAQSHSARVQIQISPLDSRVGQWVADHSRPASVADNPDPVVPH